jgi:hypothetical protein
VKRRAPVETTDALAVLARISARTVEMRPDDAVAYQLRWLDICRVVAYVAPTALGALETYAADEGVRNWLDDQRLVDWERDLLARRRIR